MGQIDHATSMNLFSWNISYRWDYIWMNMNFENRNNDIDESDNTDDER